MVEERLRGVRLLRGRLDRAAQDAAVAAARAVAAAAPFVTPVTRRGQALSVRMTAAGACGWVSDRRGYRYEDRHPSGAPWPPIPAAWLALWRDVCPGARDPDSVGFGHAFIRGALQALGGEAALRFGPEGFEARLAVPVNVIRGVRP